MKFVTILLSVYMTFLALMPCQDKDDKLVFSYHTTISKSKACKDQAGQETCPPFCTCSCCSTARTLTAQPIITIFFKVIDKQYPHSTIPAIQDQAITVWQPPQIA